MTITLSITVNHQLPTSDQLISQTKHAFLHCASDWWYMLKTPPKSANKHKINSCNIFQTYQTTTDWENSSNWPLPLKLTLPVSFITASALHFWLISSATLSGSSLASWTIFRFRFTFRLTHRILSLVPPWINHYDWTINSPPFNFDRH